MNFLPAQQGCHDKKRQQGCTQSKVLRTPLALRVILITHKKAACEVAFTRRDSHLLDAITSLLVQAWLAEEPPLLPELSASSDR